MLYDDAALTLADDAVLRHGKITKQLARELYEIIVQDGGKTTETEWRTLKFIAEGGRDGTQYRLDAGAGAFLAGKIRAEHPALGRVSPARPARPYRSVDGRKLDENALTIADNAVGRHRILRLGDVEAMWEDVQDGGKVTEVEFNTLAHVHGGGVDGEYAMTAPAKSFLWNKLQSHRHAASPAPEAAAADGEEGGGVGGMRGDGSPTTTSKNARGGSGGSGGSGRARVFTPRTSPPSPGYEWMARYAEDDGEDLAGRAAEGVGAGRVTGVDAIARGVRFVASTVTSPHTWLRRRRDSVEVEGTEASPAVSDDHRSRSRWPDSVDPRGRSTTRSGKSPAVGRGDDDTPGGSRRRHDVRPLSSSYEGDVVGSIPGGGGGVFGVLDTPVPASKAFLVVAVAFLTALLAKAWFGVAYVSVGRGAGGGGNAGAAGIEPAASASALGVDWKRLSAKWSHVEAAVHRLSGGMATGSASA